MYRELCRQMLINDDDNDDDDDDDEGDDDDDDNDDDDNDDDDDDEGDDDDNDDDQTTKAPIFHYKWLQVGTTIWPKHKVLLSKILFYKKKCLILQYHINS